MKTKVLIVDRLDIRKRPHSESGVAFNFSADYISSSRRLLGMHKADLVLYVDKEIDRPHFIEIVKWRRGELDKIPLRILLNSIVDRYIHLYELSSMFKLKLVSYDLKSFLVDEIQKQFRDVIFITNNEG